MPESKGYVIFSGKNYRYVLDFPRGCKGGIYCVHGFVLDVPSYQEKVLVECLKGKDAGMWFTCTPSNFSYRYELVEETPEQAKGEKVAEAREISMVERGAGA